MRYLIQTHSPEETESFAETMGNRLPKGSVLAFFGDLGMGKTTFTRGLARGLGLEDVVCSPTFSIVQEYHGGRLDLYHFDMYRIEDAADLESTGFYDYPLEDAITVIEWSENILAEIPQHALKITFRRLDDTTREIQIDVPGEESS